MDDRDDANDANGSSETGNPPLKAYAVEWLDHFWNRRWTTIEYAAHFEAVSAMAFKEMFASGGDKFLVSIDGPDGDIHASEMPNRAADQPREVSVLVEIDGELAEELVQAPTLEYAVDLAEMYVIGSGRVLGVTDTDITRLFGIEADDILEHVEIPDTWRGVLS